MISLYATFIPKEFIAHLAPQPLGIWGSMAGEFGIKWPILLAQMANFGIVASLLYFLALKPIIRTMDYRRKRISEGLQYAEDMKDKLTEAERQYAQRIKEGVHQAQELVDQAHQRAQQILEKSAQEAQEKAHELIQKAQKTVERERQEMMHQVHDQVADLVIKASEAVLKTELSPAQHHDFNQKALMQLKEAAQHEN